MIVRQPASPKGSRSSRAFARLRLLCVIVALGAAWIGMVGVLSLPATGIVLLTGMAAAVVAALPGRLRPGFLIPGAEGNLLVILLVPTLFLTMRFVSVVVLRCSEAQLEEYREEESRGDLPFAFLGCEVGDLMVRASGSREWNDASGERVLLIRVEFQNTGETNWSFRGFPASRPGESPFWLSHHNTGRPVLLLQAGREIQAGDVLKPGESRVMTLLFAPQWRTEDLDLGIAFRDGSGDHKVVLKVPSLNRGR